MVTVEAKKKYNKTYYEKNKKVINQNKMISYEKNRDENLKKMREYYDNNKEAIAARKKIWSRQNYLKKKENARIRKIWPDLMAELQDKTDLRS